MEPRTVLRRASALEDPGERVRRLSALLAEVEEIRDEVQAARDDAIRDLHNQGYRVAAIVDLTGVSRGRVHQILHRAR